MVKLWRCTVVFWEQYLEVTEPYKSKNRSILSISLLLLMVIFLLFHLSRDAKMTTETTLYSVVAPPKFNCAVFEPNGIEIKNKIRFVIHFTKRGWARNWTDENFHPKKSIFSNFEFSFFKFFWIFSNFSEFLHPHED